MKESDSHLLERLGDNASNWASAFRVTAIELGYSAMDEGWLMGWFANAIEHSYSIRQHQSLAQVKGHSKISDDIFDWAFNNGESLTQTEVNDLICCLEPYLTTKQQSLVVDEDGGRRKYYWFYYAEAPNTESCIRIKSLMKPSKYTASGGTWIVQGNIDGQWQTPCFPEITWGRLSRMHFTKRVPFHEST